MTKKAETDTDEQQEHLANMVNRCLDFVGRNGKVLIKKNTPIISVRIMGHKQQNLHIQSLVTNWIANEEICGSCGVKAQYEGVLVFAAEYKFTVTAANKVEARVYTPGDWEKKIPEIPHNSSILFFLD